MTETLRFLLVLEAIGLAGLPLAARALGRLPGAAVGLGRVLALLVLAWLVWIAGSLGVPNGPGLAIGGAVALAALAVLAHRRGGPRDTDPFRRRLLFTSEALFVVAFLGGALLVAYSPDVWGTEKPMDMMLVNATLTSDSFPPHDPWMAGEQLNYYYLGQLMLGLLVRLTDVEPSQGYNLALAALFAMTVTAAFTLGATFAEAARRGGMAVRSPLAAGGAAVVLLVLMGNLRGGWQALEHSGSLLRFDWFGASRVIPDTINEFPQFSFLVGDVHAHVIAVPLTLLGLAFVLQGGLYGSPRLLRARGWFETACAALAIGILYAVNSWSWPVMAGLLMLAAVIWGRKRAIAWALVVLGLGLVAVAPFIVEFDPNAKGLGVVGTEFREPLGRFVGHHLVIEGALLWLLVAPLAGRARSVRHPLRVLGFGSVAVVVAFAALADARLAGAALVALLAGVALDAALRRRFSAAERLLWMLVAASLALIAGPELLYVRDEFDGGEFARMNTVFKLGYQAWILLAIAGAVALAAGRTWLPRLPRVGWQVVAAGLIGLSLAYTAAATYARKDGFGREPSLEGRAWLAAANPGDVAAIDWLRANTDSDAVIVEAVGDDYSAFGNARMSTYSGRPAVLGWAGHELQWSHDVGTRREDVQTLYASRDAAVVRGLLARYRVQYAVIGPLERTFYGSPGALTGVGRRVFERDGTAIYAFEVDPATEPKPEATPPGPPVLG